MSDDLSFLDLLAHAHQLEEEAMERYEEMAHAMYAHNNKEVGDLFAGLAELEKRHAAAILEHSQGESLPEHAPWEWSWQTDESPETVLLSGLHYRLTPHQALCLALDGERRALAFFQQVVEQTNHEETRTLATDLARQESEHIAILERWLGDCRCPEGEWPDDPDPPCGQG